MHWELVKAEQQCVAYLKHDISNKEVSFKIQGRIETKIPQILAHIADSGFYTQLFKELSIPNEMELNNGLDPAYRFEFDSDRFKPAICSEMIVHRSIQRLGDDALLFSFLDGGVDRVVAQRDLLRFNGYCRLNQGSPRSVSVEAVGHVGYSELIPRWIANILVTDIPFHWLLVMKASMEVLPENA